MKKQRFALGSCISAALICAPHALPAQPLNAAWVEPPSQVTQTINNGQLFTIARSHFGFLSKAVSTTNLSDTASMSHMQLILNPAAITRERMESYIASQHDPNSTRFQKWLSPEQFGKYFGLADSDIAAVSEWLNSQGFTVNTVYPNKLQIDFSGTAGQVRQAFHTQEAIYTLKDGKHLANSGDISIPAALKNVVVGVMGLNDFHAKPLIKKPMIAQWNTAKKGFVLKNAAESDARDSQTSQAINFSDTSRGLVPNDMATIYGIRQIRANGITGKGITVAVVDMDDMNPEDWTNFVSVFNLSKFGGTFQQINPAPPSGANNCYDIDQIVNLEDDDNETLLDAEYATAIAPGAKIVVATCAGFDPNFDATTNNFFGGVFTAADNLINNSDAAARPNVISASYGYGEFNTDVASKTAIDLMWAQADAEGISVFVSTGDSGSNPDFNGGVINGSYGNGAVDANSLATSPHVTAVGGTDLADILRGTSSQYFATTPSVVGGSALSYVPEIPWNESCGNGVAAKSFGFDSVEAFCLNYLKYDPSGRLVTSEAGSGGPSSVDPKPAWQRQVYGTAPDQSRDLPDVSLFAGSFGEHTAVITCTAQYPCTPDFAGPLALSGGTSLASPMFAGIQALIDQGLQVRGLPADQGNAAPTLYALAAKQYGDAGGAAPGIAICSADNGATGTDNCVFHNVTSGSISSQCFQESGFATANCYYYGSVNYGQVQIGLTTSDAAPSTYGVANKAFGAHPGWSFASGLGSVNATNLLIAWRAFDHVPVSTVSITH